MQNQFATEQDYLDLFDNQKTTPAMATAYTPTNDTTGIKSIVNTATPIINQGGDGDGPPKGPGFNPDDNLGTSDYYGPGPGFIEGIKSATGGIMDFVSKGGITGMILRNIFGKKKEIEKKTSIKTATKARDRIEAERKAEIERAALAAAIEKANRPYSGPTYYNNQNTNTMGGSGGAISQDFNNTTASIDNYSSDVLRAKGGLMGRAGSRVRSYFDGGLVSLRGR